MMTSPTQHTSVKDTGSTLTEVDTVSLSSTSTSSSSMNTTTPSNGLTLNSLPPEIHIAIFSRLHYHVDATCLGLTSKHYWAVRKQFYGHRNRGKVIITYELAVLLKDWVGAKYSWDPVREIFLTKRVFAETCFMRNLKRDEIIQKYGFWEWERLVKEGDEYS